MKPHIREERERHTRAIESVYILYFDIRKNRKETFSQIVADDYFKIAKQNFICSKFLFRKKMLPEAIYFLQQTVEKIGKSWFLQYGMLNLGKIGSHSFYLNMLNRLERKVLPFLEYVEYDKMQINVNKYNKITKVFKQIDTEFSSLPDINMRQKILGEAKRKTKKLGVKGRGKVQIYNQLTKDSEIIALRKGIKNVQYWLKLILLNSILSSHNEKTRYPVNVKGEKFPEPNYFTYDKSSVYKARKILLKQTELLIKKIEE